METILKEMNFNFNNLENSIKTIGALIILICGVLLTINVFINPINFIL